VRALGPRLPRERGLHLGSRAVHLAVLAVGARDQQVRPGHRACLRDAGEHGRRLFGRFLRQVRARQRERRLEIGGIPPLRFFEGSHRVAGAAACQEGLTEDPPGLGVLGCLAHHPREDVHGLLRLAELQVRHGQ
jgi:hypothetical protein